MTNYLQLNYPENFNDWIDSDEFIALLDVVAYLGESLAFRIDINVRENFIDVATRRESILRLARFLSYSPQRNIPVTGLVKLVQIYTNDDVYDSFGTNINNQPITWNDPTNTNWYEQWILVLNNALIPTNPFGTPLQDAPVNNIDTQLYRLNNIPNGAGNIPFTTFVENTSFNFDICNANFSSSGGFSEVYPNPQAPFQFVYCNDGNGNASPNTGFFLLFKQGTLQNSDFLITQPLENRVIYINTPNINQNDVWMQTVNDSGFIVNNGVWTRVGFVPTDDISKVLVSVDNITYNSVSPSVQNIFQVVTQENDQIMLRFGDGRFGQIPVGNLRVWYRVSANQLMTITPDEMQSISINIPYLNPNQIQKTLYLSFSLQATIANGATSETSADIARRASLNYSTQARMVSGQDYNALPATNNLALKVQAINRFYSGQSRYIDLNDPTGSYQNTNVFSDDGALYMEEDDLYTEVPTSSSLSAQELVSTIIIPQLDNPAVSNFLLNEWLTGSNPAYSVFTNDPPALGWIQSPNQSYSTSGYFYTIATGIFAPVSSNALPNTTARYLSPGSLVQFTNAGWVSVISVDSQAGTGLSTITFQGPVMLSQDVLSNDTVMAVLPAFQNILSQAQINTIVQTINNNRTFGISYDFKSSTFYIIDVSTLDTINPYNYSSAYSNLDSSWLILCQYSPSNWQFTARGIDYVFESLQDVKFFFINAYKTVDTVTGQSVQDSIKVIKNTASGTDYFFTLGGNYTYSDGYIEPRRVLVDFSSYHNDGLPDNPQSFTNIIGATNSLVFHQRLTDQNGYDYYQLINASNVTIIPVGSAVPTLAATAVAYQLPVSSDITSGSFYVGNAAGLPSDYTANIGIDGVYFQWKHYAPIDQRIDPALSNMIDIFVLSSDYYNEMLTWRTNGCNPATLPAPPSESDLETAFSALEQFKMFSDEIVWRPASIKLLFGASADPSLQLTFKVVPLLGTLVSNGEIQSRLVTAVNQFFDISGWDFGETFYYSELGGYLHSQLLDCIASVVPVPNGASQTFGDLFEIRSNPDELFFPTIQVSDVDIIPSNTQSSLRINNG